MTSAVYSPRSCHWSEARGYQGLRPWNASKDAVLPAGADAGWYYPHGSYMLREIWVELLKPGGRLGVSRRMGPEAANICVGDCDRCEKPLLVPTGFLKFPLFGMLAFPRCIPGRRHCCRVYLINELFPTPRATPANCSVVVQYLHGVHAGSGGTPPWVATASTERRVGLTFVGGARRGPGARGEYLRSLEAAARETSGFSFVPMCTPLATLPAAQ